MYVFKTENQEFRKDSIFISTIKTSFFFQINLLDQYNFPKLYMKYCCPVAVLLPLLLSTDCCKF